MGETKTFKKRRMEVSTGSSLHYEKKELAVLWPQHEVISKAGLMESTGKPRWRTIVRVEAVTGEKYTGFR